MTHATLPKPLSNSELVSSEAWTTLKLAATELQTLQVKDGSVPEAADHARAAELRRDDRRGDPRRSRPSSRTTPSTSRRSSATSSAGPAGFGVPDFLDSLDGVPAAAAPRRRHCATSSCSRCTRRTARATGTSRRCSSRSSGRSSSRSSRPATTATSSSCRCASSTSPRATTPTRRCCSPRPSRCARSRTFTWGAIFQDREAARFRRVVRAAAEITKLDLPADAARMLDDQELTEKTFVMWDIIHDRTHMRGDLPFDPFMIKQRMPYFLYSLEELRCDLTAFRECVAIEAPDEPTGTRLDAAMLSTHSSCSTRDLRPHLPLRDHRHAGAQLRRPRRPAAVRVAAPARRAALDRHRARARLGCGARGGGRARRRDRRALLALDRPPEDRALARRLRARRARR